MFGECWVAPTKRSDFFFEKQIEVEKSTKCAQNHMKQWLANAPKTGSWRKFRFWHDFKEVGPCTLLIQNRFPGTSASAACTTPMSSYENPFPWPKTNKHLEFSHYIKEACPCQLLLPHHFCVSCFAVCATEPPHVKSKEHFTFTSNNP